jgi:6-hydroxytryprostatin B O-methyltransferase
MDERSNGVQSLSALEVLAGSYATPHDAPAVISKAKRSLYEATQSIQQLLLSPTDFHLHATLDLQRLAAYRWLLNFDVPDHVPLHEAVSYATVADSARVPEDQLMRFARHAMTGGLFHEPVEGYIAHTPVSAGLRRPAPVRDTMLFLTETNLPTAAKVVEMTESLTASVDTNDRTGTSSVEDPRTAFQLAHGTSLSFFPYLSKHPQIASRLAAGMRTISAASESHVSHLVTSYPWSQLPKGTTILDMGGSRGHVAVALATQYSQLKFIVQDLPPVIAEASKQILDESVRGRVSFHAHSFLEPQPVEHVNGVDVFLIRQCLNNWPYMDAVRILRAILPSMEGDHKRLLINNVVVPLPFSSCPTQQTQTGRNPVYGEGMRDEAIARVRDLAMLQLMNGAERDLRQWRSLLREADPRLEIVQVTKPEGSLLSLLEVKLKPKSGP